MTVVEKLASVAGVAPDDPVVQHLGALLRTNYGSILWARSPDGFDAATTFAAIKRFFLDRASISEADGELIEISTLVIPIVDASAHPEDIERVREIVRQSERYAAGQETEKLFVELAAPWLAALENGVPAKFLRVGPWKMQRPSGDPLFQEILRSILANGKCSRERDAVPYALSLVMGGERSFDEPPNDLAAS